MGRDSRALGAFFSLVAGLVIAGCSDGKLSNPPRPDAGPSPELAAFAGTWDGYAEATTFAPDGSDRVRLTIDVNNGGTVTIGNAPALPPATDPDVGYPPSTDPADPSGFWEGFAYPAHAAAITSSNRIQLGLDPEDILATWCPLQTSYPEYQLYVGDGAMPTFYGCVKHGLSYGFGGGNSPDGGPDAGPQCVLTDGDGGSQPIDCGKLQLCVIGNACACDATGCVARTVPAGTQAAGYPGELDATVDGTTLTGTLALPNEGRLTIHLTKTPAP
jgi:hypothetical protein